MTRPSLPASTRCLATRCVASRSSSPPAVIGLTMAVSTRPNGARTSVMALTLPATHECRDAVLHPIGGAMQPRLRVAPDHCPVGAEDRCVRVPLDLQVNARAHHAVGVGQRLLVDAGTADDPDVTVRPR